jgi:glycosyltransferase involved in cell wall biosynthesis
LRGASYDVIVLNHAKFGQRCLKYIPDNVGVLCVLHNTHEDIFELAAQNSWGWNAAVSISPKVHEIALDRFPGRPVVFIPHGVELPPEGARQYQDGRGIPLRLVFLGRLEKNKGALHLPEILELARASGFDFRLTLAGDGPEREALARDFAARGLSQYVNFLGMVPPEKVYAVMLESDIQLMPSYFEGLGLVLLEAQACGCVPVASRLPGVTDFVVEDGVTGGLVDVGDTAGFARAAVEFARDPEKWKRASQAARARVATDFSLPAMGAKYLELLDELASHRYPLSGSRSVLAKSSRK